MKEMMVSEAEVIKIIATIKMCSKIKRKHGYN
jgi:hypothetical protein